MKPIMERRSPAILRWQSALMGFLTCALLIVLMWLGLHLAAPAAAEPHVAGLMRMAEQTEAQERAWLIGMMRRVAWDGSTLLLGCAALYWLLCGLLGKGRIMAIAPANVLLSFAAACMLGPWLNAYFGWADTSCDVIPQPHQGFQLSRIHECPSSAIFYEGLFFGYVLLLVASLIARIWLSRRRVRA